MVDAGSDLLLRSRKSWTVTILMVSRTRSRRSQIFRGIYKRVAVQLDVDPSYVSRVARGERHAPFVTEALRKEIQRVLGKAGLHDGNGHNNNHNHNNNHGHNNDRGSMAITVTATRRFNPGMVALRSRGTPLARWLITPLYAKRKAKPVRPSR